MSRLKVGCNLLFLKPGRVGGTEEYVRRLLMALQTHGADEVDLTLLVNRRFLDAHGDLASTFTTVVAPITGDVPSIRIGVESSWLAYQTSRLGFDLVHHPANTLPHVRTRPSLVTIHDLQPLMRPGDFGPIKGPYLRGRLRRSAREARVVTTPSHYVRSLLIDRMGIAGDRVTVVTAPVASSAPARLGDPPPDDHGVEEPFFLYPAITHPHKNHETLLRAFARVAAESPAVSLVLTGGPGSKDHAVTDEIDRLDLHDRVRHLGWVPRIDLDDLLRRAAALTFPSRHEGYGLPVTEAMALGCPVVASAVTALPELVGDAGLLVQPDDVEGWVAAMLRLLEDEPRRATLIDLGAERVRSMTPEHAARRLIDAYRLAVGRR
ncbi:MAG: glycosyltransferase family 4 protein [Actinomycetota bacterium]